jgi:hypothetical protein
MSSWIVSLLLTSFEWGVGCGPFYIRESQQQTPSVFDRNLSHVRRNLCEMQTVRTFTFLLPACRDGSNFNLLPK